MASGAADEQIGQCEVVGENSTCSAVVKELERLTADPMPLCPHKSDPLVIHGL